VLVVINRLQDHGGAEVSTVLIIDALQGQRFEFTVITLNEPATTARRAAIEEAGGSFLTAPTGLMSRIGFVVRTARQRRVHVIHSTLFDADLVARAAGPIARVPVLSSLVSTEYGVEAFAAARSPRRLQLARVASATSGAIGVSRFHAITQAAAEHAVQRLRVPAGKVSIVPRGRVEDDLGRASAERRATVRRSLGLPDDVPVLLNVGRQEPQKGQVLLIEAFRHVVASVPRALLLVAGRDGNASIAIREAVARAGLQSSVRLLGVRDDVADLLAAADAFVFSSLWEGLGGALLEALALECPIVSFDIQPAVEVVGDCGLLVPIRDVSALSGAILRVLDDPSAARSRASAGRQRFEDRFTARAMVEGMAALYRETAELPAPPTRARTSATMIN